MFKPIRSSIKVILLNDKDELLLMCADDPKTTAADGRYLGKFWFAVGGEIELNESIEDTAYREIYEETSIKKDEIELGPIVWFGEFDLILNGTLTRLKQKFIVAKTKQINAHLKNPTSWEKKVIKDIAWFSIDDIKNSDEIIYPALLPKYLPDIISGNYPKQPIEIDLAKLPNNLK
ncbi:MAG: hypothetical protein KR126chlam4_00761 [Candidatus Anoxychlamydiales bacterium]|uniref:Nudix hydrolase domain-containing protein n=1 Tax=marine sediment metagenome TaxID=412755 RepID=A0A0F8ZR32_9ZZZZ|nr:hypothetical protein [Candidatus Anoxychlamydiales bacterium]NGX40930.1 hypothetical protein [Candidatus Anoxychlamydiales bacterium]